MSSRKRSRQAVDEAELGVIKLAAGEPIPADLLSLRAFSSCARGLPLTAQEWNLCGLQIDGQPAEQETVTAWLSCVDSVINCTSSSTDSNAAFRTATGLQKLLLFADAVGSSDGVLRACLVDLDRLQLEAKLGDAEGLLQLETDGRAYNWVSYSADTFDLSWTTTTSNMRVQDDIQEQHKDQFMQEVAAQLEALLVTAHKLHLQPLLQHLHNFLFSSLSIIHEDGCALFDGWSHLLFTDRLFDAALGSGTVSREQYLTSVLARPCDVIDSALHKALLAPKSGSVSMCDVTKCVTFEAQLKEPLLGSKAGDAVGVALDLCGEATLTFGDIVSVPVQLMVGCVVRDVAQLPQLFPKE